MSVACVEGTFLMTRKKRLISGTVKIRSQVCLDDTADMLTSTYFTCLHISMVECV